MFRKLLEVFLFWLAAVIRCVDLSSKVIKGGILIVLEGLLPDLLPVVATGGDWEL